MTDGAMSSGPVAPFLGGPPALFLGLVKARLLRSLGLLLLVSGCAATPSAPTEEEALVAAISNFDSLFGSNIVLASLVVVPRSSDLMGVNKSLEGDPLAVHSSNDEAARWRVSRLALVEDHWEIDIETSDGPNLFAATILIRADSSGLPVVLDPEDLGVTPTSVIS